MYRNSSEAEEIKLVDKIKQCEEFQTNQVSQDGFRMSILDLPGD